MNKELFLSKSLYLNGLQCKKYLWLKIHDKEKLQEPDDSLKAIFATGDKVGEKACELFPGGKQIKYDKTVSHSERIAQTKKFLADGVKTIYEATFEFDGVLVMIDILNIDNNNNFEIYEVKSSTWNSKKSLKDIEKYIKDASIQYYVLKGCGHKISKTSVTLLNGEYIRGAKENINKLFIHKNVTKEVISLQKKIPETLRSFRATLEVNNHEPNIDIGWHCKKPSVCFGFDYCWKQQRNIPDYSVFDIFPLTKKSKAIDLYKKSIVDIKDIPESLEVTKTQKNKIDLIKKNKLVTDKREIKLFLSSLNYPLYYFDFEAFNQAIPSIIGVKPFQQIPFQYSLHIRSNFSEKPSHKEFLAKPDEDPRENLVKKLVSDIPKEASVLVFNASYEKLVLGQLAEHFPEHKEHLLNISKNIIDLAEPFRKQHYYHPQMKGKYSIKVLLPILVPEMSTEYDKLDLIKNGGDAMRAFANLSTISDPEEINKIRKSLIEYCKLDTFAMVKIHDKLRTM